MATSSDGVEGGEPRSRSGRSRAIEDAESRVGELETELVRLRAENRALRMGLMPVPAPERPDPAASESQPLFGKMAEMMPALVYLFDLSSGRSIYSNWHARSILGYPAGYVWGLGAFVQRKLMHDDDLTRLPAHFSALAAMPDGAERGFEYRLHHADGSWRWFHSRDTVFARAPDGRPQTILGAAVDVSDDKRVDEQLKQALRESEERFRMAIERSPVSVWRQDRELRYTWIYNPHRLPAPQQYIGHTDHDLYPANVARYLTELKQRVLDTGESHRFELTAEIDARLMSLDISIEPVRDEDGAVIGITGAGIDFSDRKRAEEALERNQNLLRAILETTPNPVFVKDRLGKMVLANPATVRVVGKPLAALLGHTDAEFFDDPAVAAAIRDNDQRIMASGRGESLEEVVQTPDGYRVLLSTKVPHLDAAGRVIGIICLSRDITDRKRAEEALRESEERLRILAEALPQIVWTADENGNTDFYNARWSEYSGLPSGSGPTARAETLLHPDDILPTRTRWQKSLATGQPYETEYRLRRGDGQYRWFLARAYPLRGPEGNALRWFGTCTDIHDLKEADRRKSEFLAMLSHELRNPLAPIHNSLFVLDHSPPESDTARRAKAILDRQIGHLTRLVDDLLDVTRISRGKLRLIRERFDLTDLARRTAEDHRATMAERQIRFELRVPDDPIEVHGDATRLAQAIGNLFANAAKFTDRGGEVIFSLARQPAGTATVSVRDSGMGIPPEMLPRLFEPFIQADRSLDRSQGGLGLGLSLVRGVAEMHGGSVAAYSDGPGHGSEFVIMLPAEVRTMKQEPVDAPKQERSSRKRLLIIEDNVDAAASLRDALELSEHEVEVAHTGPDGLAKARLFRPDVVLCDIGLPGMDGFEVAQAFRSDETLRGAYLVALTGYALPEDLRRAAAAGFAEHLRKPPGLDTIERLVAAAPRRREI